MLSVMYKAKAENAGTAGLVIQYVYVYVIYS